MKNIFARLNKNTAGGSSTDIVAELTERNRKFEAFLLDKLADLESKIIPEPDDIDFAEIEDVPDGYTDAPTGSPLDDVLRGSSLLSQSPATSPEGTDTVDENWLAGFDDDTPPDVDAALTADDGEKEAWS